MTTKGIFKIGLLFTFITAGLGFYLALQLLSSKPLTINSVKAQNTNCPACAQAEEARRNCDYYIAQNKVDKCGWEDAIEARQRECDACRAGGNNGGKCGNNVCPAGFTKCNPFNQFECVRPDDAVLSAKCRYRSGGGSCAPAEFLEGSYSLDNNEMAFCMGGRLLAANRDGWTYMESAVSGSIRCAQNGQDPARLCEGKSGIIKGAGTTCNNPYKCPQQPTPTPQPKSRFKVVARCDGSIDLPGIDFSVSRGGQVLARGRTGDTVEVDGQAKVDVFTGRLPASITDRYPNINPKAERSMIGQDIRSEYVFEYSGCKVTTPAATRTPAPTPSSSPSPSPSPSPRLTPSASPSPTVTRVPQSTPTPAPKNPNVVISKALIADSTISKDGTVKFNITVKNTGNVDITNFSLSDDYVSSDKDGFIRFDRVTYKTSTVQSNCSRPGEGLCPKQEEGTNGRKRLLWENLPPKSGVLSEDGVLNINEEFVLTVEFTMLKVFEGNPGDLNDNCSTIHTIIYRDSDNTEKRRDVNGRSCDEFFSEKPSPLVVDITKVYTGGAVVLPNDVTFRAEIKNTSKSAYTDIDFTDEYDQKVLKLKSVVVKKGNISVNVESFSSTVPSLVIRDLQSLKSKGSDIGGLQPGESYIIEIVYTAQAVASSTCDTVTANVSDGTNRVSDNARVCSDEITAPNPPETGASFLLNFVVPMITLGGATLGKVYIKER